MAKVSPVRGKTATTYATLGFGVPASSDPHHFKVIIPRASAGDVEIIEYLGMQAQNEDLSTIHRVVLDRKRWTAIRAEVQRAFNVRLKAYDLKTSSWRVGENVVDRLLGKELCVLAWAVESMEIENIPVAIRNWLALRPEERWWLFGMTAVSTGEKDDRDVGWRVALKHALGDIVQTEVNEPSQNYSSGSVLLDDTKDIGGSSISETNVQREHTEKPLPVLLNTFESESNNSFQAGEVNNESSAMEETLFLFEAKQAKAAGHPLGDMSKPKFVVTKGSTANIQQAKSLRPTIRELRQELIEKGILVEDKGVYSFTKEYIFKSPSAAACVIAGNPRSGMDAWRNMKGQSLKELGYGKKI